MNRALESPVLVLNRNYQPVRVATAKQAFTMLYVGRARALDADFELFDFAAWTAREPGHGEPAVGTPTGRVSVPRLLLLVRYGRVPRTRLRLSRRNIFIRDAYTCQYCDLHFTAGDLNLDHVLPRSRGGDSSWENLVTSCRPCNLRKGRCLPLECGMPLKRPPRPPPWTTVVQMVAVARRFVEWEPFLPSLGALPDTVADAE